MIGERYRWCLQKVGAADEMTTLVLNDEVAVIGRSKDATHKLKSIYLSRTHATLRFSADHWTVKDNGSINGTYINNRRLNPDENHPLGIGDIIGFGMPLVEPITENSVVYRLCREDTEPMQPAVQSTPPNTPERSVQAATDELPDLSMTVFNPGADQVDNGLTSVNPGVTKTASTSQKLLSECSINVPRCDSMDYNMPNGVNWENCNRISNPVNVKLENEMSYENSRRKMKVTPQRHIIDLCDSDDEYNADVSNSITCIEEQSHISSPVPLEGKPPQVATNDNIKLSVDPQCTSVIPGGCTDHSNVSSKRVSCSRASDKTVPVESETCSERPILCNESVTGKESCNKTTKNALEVMVNLSTTDDSDDAAHVCAKNPDEEMQDNFGYSQDDEVILISDDESYFSQKNVITALPIKEEVEDEPEDAINIENDDWAAILPARFDTGLDVDHSESKLDISSAENDKLSSMEFETSSLDQPGPSGYQPKPVESKALNSSVLKDSDYVENDFFPILSQTFDSSTEESDNESSHSDMKNLAEEKVSDSDQKEVSNVPTHPSFKFYKPKDTVYDRLKRKSGDEVPTSIKSTRLTLPQPLQLGRRRSFVSPTPSPVKAVKPVAKVVSSHASASDKTKSKSSLRDRMQHKMGHRIPHPGGGSAVPSGPKSGLKPQQRKATKNDDHNSDKNKSLKRGKTMNAPHDAPNSDVHYSGAKNALVKSAANVLTSVSSGSLDANDIPEGLPKVKSIKVPQRIIASRSDMFAAAFKESDSKPVQKRKGTLQKPIHPAKKPNIGRESKENGEKVEERKKLAKPKQTILLPGDFNGIRPGMELKPPLTQPVKLSTTEKKSKKSVRFSDNVTTYLIERVTLEDLNSQQLAENGDNMDVFQHRPEVVAAVNRIRDICLSWKSAWLHEQENCQYPPPVLPNKSIKPTMKSYASPKEYADVFEPLLLFELWDSISSDWRQRRRTLPNFQLVLNRIDEDPQPPSRPQFLLLHCHVLLNENEEKFGQYPQEGWLTILEVYNTITDGTGRSSVLRAFAYVESCNKTSLHYLQRDGRLAPLLRELASKSKTKVSLVLKLVLRTKYRNFSVSLDRPSNLEMISYVRPQLRLFQALHFVPCLPLGMQILKPHQSLCTVPSFPQQSKLVHVGNIMYNTLQRRAILRVTESVVTDKSPKICLIQGPPGTGKTSLVVGLIVQLLFGPHADEGVCKPKILLCAPSNNAVDEDLRRLLELRESLRDKGGLRAVRVGQMEGIHVKVKPYSLENIIRTNIESRSGPDGLQREINDLTTNINCKQQEFETLMLRRKTAEANKIAADIRRLKNLRETSNRHLEDWHHMTPEEYLRQFNVWREQVLVNADVIATTLGSCTQHGMEVFLSKQQSPFVCIIDEATQCTEPDVLLPLQFGMTKLILVGDPQQLPATVKSLVAKEKLLSLSLFERLESNFRDRGSHPAIMLEMQYRMHPELCAYPSRAFYRSRLRTDSELIKKLESVPFVPYIVFDVADSAEETAGIGNICNTKEAVFVTKLCEALLLKSDVYKIGVITFYSHQMRCLTEHIRKSTILKQKDPSGLIEINTVDSFQGREKDVIIMSTVRAKSANGGIGFVNDQRRLNVAITRGRCSLYICGHLSSLRVSEHWRGLIQDAQNRKKIQKLSSMIGLSVLQDIVLKS